MASKKSFDREKMYRKIMPTYYATDEELAQQSKEASDQTDNNEVVSPEQDKENEKEHDVEHMANQSLLNNIEMKRLQDRDEKVILYNLTEHLVISKLEMVLKNMNCCKCDRCKMDILAIALNNLEPHYVVSSKNIIDEKVIRSKLSQQATAEVLKAALRVRKCPRH